jgi:hypothetical protein
MRRDESPSFALEATHAHKYEQMVGNFLARSGIMVILHGNQWWEVKTPTLQGLVRIHYSSIWSVFDLLFLVYCKFSREPPPWIHSSEGRFLSPQVASCLSIKEMRVSLVLTPISSQSFGFNLYSKKHTIF